MLDEVSVEAVSKALSKRVLDIGIEGFWGRTGKKPWGYVEPGEVAWELLEQAVEGLQNDI